MSELDVSRLRVAVSTCRGEPFLHLFADDPAVTVYGRKTLCGKSILGWATDLYEPELMIDCERCRRALARRGS